MTVRIVVLIGGLALAGLGVYFLRIGLDSADKLASVIGAFTGLIGLAVSVWATVQARQPTPASPPSRLDDEAGRADLELKQFRKATDRLAGKTVDVRIGAIYALEQIARDSPKLHWPIVEILTAFIREHAQLDTDTQPPEGEQSDRAHSGTPNPKMAAINETGPTASGRREPSRRPPGDIQAALRVLGRRNAARDVGRIELGKANLHGADLREANLHGANLRRANLQEADLRNASIDRANLQGADLRGARLDRANLQHSNVSEANLRGAILTTADLSGTDLSSSNLVLAYMVGANLHGARLLGAKLEQANLTRANLSEASLFGAQVKGAVFEMYEEYGYEAQGLTWTQLNNAVGVEQAYLPTYLKRASADSP